MLLRALRFVVALGCVAVSAGVVSGAPVITHVVPNQVGLAGGTQVNVFGDDFEGSSLFPSTPSLTVNGAPGGVLFTSDTQIDFFSPAFNGIHTSLLIQVETDGDVSNPVWIPYNPTPIVGGINQTVVEAGDILTITGTNFEHVTGSLKIGGVTAPVLVSNFTHFTLGVPAGIAPGMQDIVLHSSAFGQQWSLGSVQVVPEPSTLGLVGLACVCLGVRRRRSHS